MIFLVIRVFKIMYILLRKYSFVFEIGDFIVNYFLDFGIVRVIKYIKVFLGDVGGYFCIFFFLVDFSFFLIYILNFEFVYSGVYSFIIYFMCL